jgi:hypothetical protein
VLGTLGFAVVVRFDGVLPGFFSFAISSTPKIKAGDFRVVW